MEGRRLVAGMIGYRSAEAQDMNKPIPPELIDELEKLDDDAVARVVAYAKSLGTEDKLAARNAKLRELVGSISKEDMEIIRTAIEDGCERIDHDGW